MRPFEGGTAQRSLPSIKAFAAEPAVRWLERNLAPSARGRVLTVFAYGSYLGWRLPTLSQSIDTRGGIFPDSAALPDLDVARGATHLGPWRSSDLAIVPLTFPVARVLDEDPDWLKIGVCDPSPWAPTAPRAGLWVRRRWWSGARKADSSLPRGGVLKL
jgi:hypothetical protein